MTLKTMYISILSNVICAVGATLALLGFILACRFFFASELEGAFIEGRFLLLQHSLAIQSIVMCFQRTIKNGLIAINLMLERGLVEAYEHKIFYTYRYFTDCS